MGTTRNVDMSATQDTIKIVASDDQSGEEQPVVKKRKPTRVRSNKYKAVRAQIDKTRTYDAFSAIELVKKLSYAKFDATLEAHGVVKKTGITAEVRFPHTTGKTQKIAVVSDDVLKKIEAGETDFDVLLATPADMKSLTKHARVLGPRGLMPNPKNGTITDDPAARKKELEKGGTQVKTEKKAPLFHVTFGKTSMDTKALVENLEAITKAFKTDLEKLSISATMSPGVKVQL